MKLSIPLGELDFLGRFPVVTIWDPDEAFNSPWGIRFPWTILAVVVTILGCYLSIPLGELDFLGHEARRHRTEIPRNFQFPLGN